MKISVIVNSYKGTEEYLPECLDSIVAQTTQPFEVIVVLDGYDKPVVYPGTTTIIRDKNIGIALSRDEGVRMMKGTHILFVDADDVLPENYLYEMKVTMQWKKVDIVYPSCVLWSRWGENPTKENSLFNPPMKATMKDMTTFNQIVVTSLMKKKVYEAVGGFDPDLMLFEDWKFFLTAMKMGFKVYRASCFLKYRQRGLSRNRANEAHKDRVYSLIKSEFSKKV
jgi:glycosyltransferase involved in cell wall biosynthesis